MLELRAHPTTPFHIFSLRIWYRWLPDAWILNEAAISYGASALRITHDTSPAPPPQNRYSSVPSASTLASCSVENQSFKTMDCGSAVTFLQSYLYFPGRFLVVLPVSSSKLIYFFYCREFEVCGVISHADNFSWEKGPFQHPLSVQETAQFINYPV